MKLEESNSLSPEDGIGGPEVKGQACVMEGSRLHWSPKLLAPLGTQWKNQKSI